MNIFKKKKKRIIKKESALATAFSTECTMCGVRMKEIVYSREVHQEMYWCPRCGTINLEVNAEDTWLIPTYVEKKKKEIVYKENSPNKELK